MPGTGGLARIDICLRFLRGARSGTWGNLPLTGVEADRLTRHAVFFRDSSGNYGFSRREIQHIVDVSMDHLAELCPAWEKIHGIV